MSKTRKAFISGTEMQIPEVNSLQDIISEGYYAVKGFNCPIVVIKLSPFSSQYFGGAQSFTNCNNDQLYFAPTGTYIHNNKYCLIKVSETTSHTYAVKANNYSEARKAENEIQKKFHDQDMELTMEGADDTIE